MGAPATTHPLLTPLRPLLEGTGAPSSTLTDLPGGAISWLAAELAAARTGPLVLVTGRGKRAEAIYRELLFFSSHLPAPPPLLPFPAWETLPFDRLSPFGPLVGERIATLFRLAQMSDRGPVQVGDEWGNHRGLVITTPAALMQRVMPRELLSRHGFSIARGDQIDLPAFRAFLDASGYRAVSQVSEPGEFAVRGGIIDFFPAGREDPVRVELFGDEVETLRLFDPVTQRSTDPLPRIQALPASEVILNPDTIRAFRTGYRETFGGKAAEDEIYRQISRGEPAPGMEHFLPLFYEPAETLFDYLPGDTLFLLDADGDSATDAFQKEIEERHAIHTMEDGGGSRHLPVGGLYLPREEMRSRLGAFAVLENGGDRARDTSMGFHPAPDFAAATQAGGQSAAADVKTEKSPLERTAAAFAQAHRDGFRVCLATRTIGQRERLRELLADHDITTRFFSHWAETLTSAPGAVGLVVGDVEFGFVHGRLGLLLLSEDAIFGPRVRRRRVDRQFLDQLLAGFADLKAEDPVVHTDHGIGRFGGLQSLAVGEVRNDFLLISYANDDKLYVPVEDLDRVSKYTGGDNPDLDKLGGVRWERTKSKAQKKILEMAGELVKLQALRASRTGFAFSGPDPLYQEFSAAFPYEETPDQAHAIETVLEDMARPKPMDRLVCGDVGFGKTEVALRATFRAAMDGKQVAVLTPTTILAQQHFETFTQRLGAYPIRVELLSRFRTPAQQKKIIDALAEGQAEVVIGTHRLLQSDVRFKDLGLLVVDEEQRFGVVHKEKIKSFRATVDILTLTATPIPRTMHMAMAGVRDISIIASPPVDRMAIRTIITQYDRSQIREAILREIYRGGQVFYLYNRVGDLDKRAAELAELVPEAKVGVAHGQMREGRLERIMLSFYRQEFNILVCTTIIENGVDIPTANTIIIHRADRFGLAQLHQLRGRVGRSKRRAYAYLLIPPPQSLGDDAMQRLNAIETLGELGAGFSLATHDLEIRGSGNILGDEQSGQIREVGFDLYNQMLRDAIRSMAHGDDRQPAASRSGEGADAEKINPVISLSLSTHLPDSYITDVHQRLALYKRIAELSDPEAVRDMRVEIIDRFGPLPDSADNLLKVIGIKRTCHRLKILKLEAGPKGASIRFHPQPHIDPTALIAMIQSGGGRVRFDNQTHTLSLKERDWTEPARRLKELENTLRSLALPQPEAVG